MSEYIAACPSCRQRILCDTQFANQRVACPLCQHEIIMPAPPAATVAATTPSASPAAAATNPPEKKALPLAVILTVLVSVVALGAGGLAYHFHANNIAASPSPTPPPVPPATLSWQRVDVGEVGTAGSFHETNGVFTLTGAGGDIYDRSDSFCGVFQKLAGDGSISARVLKCEETHRWAMAGVMIRETATSNSPFALMCVHPVGDGHANWRNSLGIPSVVQNWTTSKTFPQWVKLERKGNLFTFYNKSRDEDPWHETTEQIINLATPAQVGLIVCSHSRGTLCTAQFDQVILSESP